MQPIGQQTAEREGSQPIIVPPVATTAPAIEDGALLRRPRASEPPANAPAFDTTEEENLA
jgi:hypothetical protein